LIYYALHIIKKKVSLFLGKSVQNRADFPGKRECLRDFPGKWERGAQNGHFSPESGKAGVPFPGNWERGVLTEGYRRCYFCPRCRENSVARHRQKTKTHKIQVIMKKLSLLIAIILLTTMWTSCQKEKFKPDYHVDVFRCKVNGEDWAAFCPGAGLWGCEPIDCQYLWKNSKAFELGAVRTSHDNSVNQSIKIYIPRSDFGENELVFITRAFKDWNKLPGCRFFNLDTTSVRLLTILEEDNINHLIKGTFEFTAINECQDTIRITDGYFHVNYRF
jgi:hypothetical protein